MNFIPKDTSEGVMACSVPALQKPGRMLIKWRDCVIKELDLHQKGVADEGLRLDEYNSGVQRDTRWAISLPIVRGNPLASRALHMRLQECREGCHYNDVPSHIYPVNHQIIGQLGDELKERRLSESRG